MTGRKIKVGPWLNGYNRQNAQHPHLLKSTELAYLKNMSVQSDGTLVQRPGFVSTVENSPLYAGGVTGIELIGNTRDNRTNYMLGYAMVTTPTESRIMYSNDGASWYDMTYSSGRWAGNTQKFSDVVYYDNKYWFLADKSSSGTMYSSSDATGGDWTVVPNAPKGDRLFVWRDRLFVINFTSNTVLFSKATDPTIWAQPDGGFFEVGNKVISVVLAQEGMYLFGSNNTWMFTFVADPTIDGYLRTVSNEFGGIDAILYNDKIIVVNYSGIYQIINGSYIALDDTYNTRDYINNAAVNDGLGVTSIGDNLLMGPIDGFADVTHAAYTIESHSWADVTFGDPSISPSCKKTVRAENNNQSVVIFKTGLLSIGHIVSKPWIPGIPQVYSMDVMPNGQCISPEYSAKTGYLDFGDRGAWKRLYYVNGLGASDLPVGDASCIVLMAINGDPNTPDLSTVYSFETNFEKTVRVKSLRFQAINFSFYKPKTALPINLGYTGNTTVRFEIWGLTLNAVLKDQKELR